MKPTIPACTLPAAHAPGVGLAASSGCQSVGGVHPLGRNARQWQEIAYFLSGFRPVQSSPIFHLSATACDVAGQAQRRTAPGAGFQALPDGNHGDNRILHK